MAELKTKATTQDPKEFLNSIEPEQKRLDGIILLEIFQRITGEKAVMWGTAIVGFGKYHYKSERSSQEGDWPLAGFSPRKQNLTLYTMPSLEKDTGIWKRLGKHTTSKGCLYIKRLADVNKDVLEEVIKNSYETAKKTLL